MVIRCMRVLREEVISCGGDMVIKWVTWFKVCGWHRYEAYG